MKRLVVLAVLLAGCPAPEGPVAPPAAADAGADRQVYVGEAEPFAVELPEGHTATWFFGDGTEATGAELEHTWTEPGHYLAFLVVASTDGSSAQDTFVVDVVHAPMAAAPSNSSALALQGGEAWAVLPEHGLLARVDLATGAVTHADVGARPRSVAAFGTLVAVASEDDTVRVLSQEGWLDVPTGYGSRPFGVAIGSDGRVWATLQGTGELVVLSVGGDGWAIRERVPLGPDLRGLAVSDDAVVVTRHRSGEGHGEAWVVDPEDGAVSPLTLAKDPGPDSDTGARGTPTYLQRVALRPDGRVATVAGTQSNMDRGIWRDGNGLTHETSVRATIRTVALDPGEGTPAIELPMQHFDDRGLASAVAYDPRGDWLYVAMHGMETVDVVDPYSRSLAGSFPDVGAGPQGLAVGDDGVLWILNALDRTLVGYPTDDLATLPDPVAVIDLQPPSGEVWTEAQARGAVIFHRSADVRMTKDGYVSCASCHLDGEPDNLTWDFTDRAEGLRNTHSLLGGGTGPLHHSGNFDELQDFENDIRGPQEGHGFLDDADWDATADTLGPPKAGLSPELDDLAAFIESLPHHLRSPHRTNAGGITVEAADGQALFEDPVVGCAGCHPAPSFTDSQWLAPGEPLLHDVGTLQASSGQRLGGELTGIDTPTLRGVFATAPYLHDGSAPTIRAVLDANVDDRHGVTSHLTDAQLDQLATYVLSIE